MGGSIKSPFKEQPSFHPQTLLFHCSKHTMVKESWLFSDKDRTGYVLVFRPLSALLFGKWLGLFQHTRLAVKSLILWCVSAGSNVSMWNSFETSGIAYICRDLLVWNEIFEQGLNLPQFLVALWTTDVISFLFAWALIYVVPLIESICSCWK